MEPNLPSELLDAIQNVYAPAGIALTAAAAREAHSAEYEACRLGLNGHTVVFRVAKTTPTKIGQFVTLWKRPLPGGEIAPLDTGDGVDFVVVGVSSAQQRGQFVFDRQTLVRKGVMSHQNQGGKRAIRVYPPWSQPTAKEALRTQQWQLQYFLPLSMSLKADSDPDGTVDLVRRLFGGRS